MASNAQNYALLKMSLCITTYGSGGTWDGNAQKESSLSNLPKTMVTSEDLQLPSPNQ